MHEKHAVEMWNGGSHPGLCLKTRENQGNLCLVGRPVTGPAGCILTAGQQFANKRWKSRNISLTCAVVLWIICVTCNVLFNSYSYMIRQDDDKFTAVT